MISVLLASALIAPRLGGVSPQLIGGFAIIFWGSQNLLIEFQLTDK
jgi:hypothetical protein